MKLIGKGAFTKAYLLETGQVLLKTNDPIKECMAHGWFPDSDMFPKLDFKNLGEYLVEYFPKVKSLKQALDPKEYQLYKALRSLSFYTGQNKHLAYYHWHKQFDSLSDDFAEQKEVLKDALDSCANFGTDVQFEISPRNVAVKNGKLVLLDCFFLINHLNLVNSNKRVA